MATVYRHRAGLGATGTETATLAAGTAASIAGANTGAIAGALGLAVPVVGVAIAGIALAVTTWLNRMGPKQKRWTSQIADEVTAQLADVKRVYLETPYNPANQETALNAVDQLLAALEEGCGQSTMGDAGQRCISERLVRGGSAPWCPTGTGCDYFTEYRDPIANDPRALEWVPPTVEAVQTLNDFTASIPASVSQLAQSPWVPFALAGLVVAWALSAVGEKS